MLALLFVFPILGSVVTEPHWREWLTEWSPMSAGVAAQATRGIPGDHEMGASRITGVQAGLAVRNRALGCRVPAF